MCKDLTELISGMLHPLKHKFIPEVPGITGYNYFDMMFFREDKTIFVIEYKLNNPKSLLRQIQNYPFAIGIVNQKVDYTKKIFEHQKYFLFQYTGLDSEKEIIANRIKGIWETSSKKRPFGSSYLNYGLSVYWWGYLNDRSSLDGGFKIGKRLSFYELYKKAIFNLQEAYNWNLDFYLVYSVLRRYSIVTAKKYFTEVMREHNGI